MRSDIPARSDSDNFGKTCTGCQDRFDTGDGPSELWRAPTATELNSLLIPIDRHVAAEVLEC